MPCFQTRKKKKNSSRSGGSVGMLASRARHGRKREKWTGKRGRREDCGWVHRRRRRRGEEGRKDTRGLRLITRELTRSSISATTSSNLATCPDSISDESLRSPSASGTVTNRSHGYLGSSKGIRENRDVAGRVFTVMGTTEES